jgi:hypothetical protein
MNTFRKHFLSAAVILTGVGSAYAGHSANQAGKTAIPMDGYVFNQSIGTCEKVAECSTDPGPICTVNNIPGQPQARGLDSAGDFNTCNVELSQRQ